MESLWFEDPCLYFYIANFGQNFQSSVVRLDGYMKSWCFYNWGNMYYFQIFTFFIFKLEGEKSLRVKFQGFPFNFLICLPFKSTYQLLIWFKGCYCERLNSLVLHYSLCLMCDLSYGWVVQLWLFSSYFQLNPGEISWWRRKIRRFEIVPTIIASLIFCPHCSKAFQEA